MDHIDYRSPVSGLLGTEIKIPGCWLILVLAAAGSTYLLVSRRTATAAKKLNMPLLDLDGTPTQMRYLRETGKLLAKGYDQYTKKGEPFCLPNVADPKRPIVVLPLRYIEEVKDAPQSKISLPAYFDKVGQVHHIGAPAITEQTQYVVKRDLNRALVTGDLIKPLEQVCSAAYERNMPPCQEEWTSVMPYEKLQELFMCMSARMVAGPDLDEEWVPVTQNYVNLIVAATRAVKTDCYPGLRWLAKYMDEDVKEVYRCRRAAAEVVRPAVEARLLELKSGEQGASSCKNQDALDWLIDAQADAGLPVTPDSVAQDMLLITVVSTHTTTATALWILYDLVDHPESVAELRQEIMRVKERYRVWNRQALGELRKLDSFMTESMRVHTLSQTSINRMVMQPYTFNDGLHLPAGTQLAFATYPYSQDDDVHPNPAMFDAKRHLRKRRGIDTDKYHFASTADTLAWGVGPHACPGRFFAQDALKLIFIHMLTHYEFKWPEEGKCHPDPDTPENMSIMPDVAAPILFKEKVV